MRNFLLGLAIIIVPLLASSCNQGKEGESGATLPRGRIIVGRQLPTFKFATLDGQIVDLKDYLGRPLMINFWATWCPPCKAEIPDFVDFYNTHRDDNLEIIGLGVDDTVEDQRKFLQKQEIPWILGLDEKNVFDYWGLVYVPTTIFVNTEGKVVEIVSGQITKERLSELESKLFE